MMLALTPPCTRCASPYFAVVLFSLSLALISPSVNPSIPIVTGKERLAFVFSMFRALSSITAGVFFLITGIVQGRTAHIRGGYYWVLLHRFRASRAY